MKKIKLSLLLSVAVSVLLTGCIDGQDNLETEIGYQEGVNFEDISPAKQPDPFAIEKVNNLFSIPLALQSKKENIIQSCMAEKGLKYTKKTENISEYQVRDFVLPAKLSLEDARVNGYMNSSNLLEKNQANEQDSNLFLGLNGTENGKPISVAGVTGKIQSDGCLAHAYQQVYGSPESGLLVEAGGMSLPIPYLNAAHLDPMFNEIDKKWSQCMKNDFSLDFLNPDHTNTSPESGSIDVAVADATCREQVGYEEAIDESLKMYLTVFLDDHENIIAEINSAKDKNL